MNRKELIAAVAAEAGMTHAEAGKALKAVISCVGESLTKGEPVILIGFGTFSVVDRPARPARNPRTGEPIELAAKKVVKFKPGKELAEKMK